MVLRWSARKYVIVVALFSPHAQAQAIELSGGVSTFSEAKGGTVAFQGKSTEAILGAGMLGGHLALGATSIRHFEKGAVIAGQQEMLLDLPTDLFNTGHISFGTGLGVDTHLSDNSLLHVFLGGSSRESGSVLFRSTTVEQFTTYGRWTSRLSKRCEADSLAYWSTALTVLGSASCSVFSGVRWAASLGYGGGAPYGAASLAVQQRRIELKAAYVLSSNTFQRGGTVSTYTPEPIRENVAIRYKLSRHFEVAGLRQHSIANTALSSGYAANTNAFSEVTLNMVGAQFTKGSFFAHGNALFSSVPQYTGGDKHERSDALSVGFVWSRPRVRWAEDVFLAKGTGNGRTALLLNGLTYRFSPRLSLSETVTVSGSGVSFSHGGSLLATRTSTDISYQVYYNPARPNDPIQQLASVAASAEVLHGVAVHLATSVSLGGKPLYTIQLGKVLAAEELRGESTRSDTLGDAILHGRVADTHGQPIEGAAVLIDSRRLYTDAEGYFSFRESRVRSHSFRVLTKEFLTVEQYAVVTAPQTVVTANASVEQVSVVVARDSEQAAAAQPLTGDASSLR